MKKHQMFELVRESVEKIQGLEKLSLKHLINPDDPKSENLSPIKVAVTKKTFGEFQLGNTILAVTQEHRFGQPPLPIGFSLPMHGINGHAILYSILNDRLALLAGEIGSSDGKMFQLPSPEGGSVAVFAWLKNVAENTFWET